MSRFITACVLAVVVVGASLFSNRVVFAQQLDAEAIAASPVGSVRSALGVGDKLKIVFYETIDVGAAKQGSSRQTAETQGALKTFYQRMDLSGDYIVEHDGAIFLPLLGRFQAETRALDDLRSELASSFAAVIGRSANIDVKIVDRAPVYVVGLVKNPGAYKHVSGMIVLHAIALAGGIDRGQDSVVKMIEGIREMERSRSMTLQIKQLIARRARLEAERDGLFASPTPVQLVKLAGEDSARILTAMENKILQAEQAKRQQQAKEITMKVAAARSELEALKRKLDQVQVQKEMRVERLGDMQKLKDRGWMTNNSVVVLRTEMSDIEAHRQDYLVQVVQAETRLAEAEAAAPRMLSDEEAARAKAIGSIEKELADLQGAMTSAKALAAFYGPGGAVPQVAGYEIVRQSKEGPQTIAATETSSLMPGDVLKIQQKMAVFGPASTPLGPQFARATTIRSTR